MKTLLILVAIAGLSLPFSACANKTYVHEDAGGKSGGTSVREDTTVRERSNGGTVYERDVERRRD